MHNRIVLKLGGSVITDKAASKTEIRYDVLAGIAREIARYPNLPLLIVHGAGSCGHPQAKQYHLDVGVTMENRTGIFETHDAVASLNREVVSALRRAGLEAVPIHPLHGCLAEDGRLISYETGHLDRMLSIGVIPVMHGDVVMDTVRGACIVSGDQLIRVFAKELGMNRVGLATDVAGLLDANGSVVRELRRSMAHTVEIGQSGHVDVTGGMEGKIAELLSLADIGITSEIFHISEVPAFLAGTDHHGTRVLAEQA